jgi:hypothetical protein
MCGEAICDDCTVYDSSGLIVCRRCLSKPPGDVADLEADSGEIPLREVVAAPSPRQARAAGPGAQCVNHPAVPAVTRCFECHSPICMTCDFAFEGAIHLCPACATNPKQKLSPGRKAKIFWSMGLGGGSLVCFLGSIILARMSGPADQATVQMLGCFLMLMGVAALVGLILGLTSFSRKAHNPGYIWVGIVLNTIVVALFVLLMIAGLMRE